MSAASSLVDDLSYQIQLVQSQIMPLIQQATAVGDFNEIQRLMKDMELKINTLIENNKLELFKPAAVEQKWHIYESPYSSLNLNDIVYDYEREIFTKMEVFVDGVKGFFEGSKSQCGEVLDS